MFKQFLRELWSQITEKVNFLDEVVKKQYEDALCYLSMYNLFRREAAYRTIGFMILFFPSLVIMSAVYISNFNRLERIDRFSEILSTLEKTNDFTEQEDDTEDFSIEDIGQEFDVVKIEKGKLGVKEFLKLRECLKLHVEDIETLLKNISKSKYLSISDLKIIRLKNNECSLNVSLVKSRLNK